MHRIYPINQTNRFQEVYSSSYETKLTRQPIMSKNRKDRSDIQVGNLEKKCKLEPGIIRNTDQTDARSDKELGNLQREYGEEAMKGMLGDEKASTEVIREQPNS